MKENAINHTFFNEAKLAAKNGYFSKSIELFERLELDGKQLDLSALEYYSGALFNNKNFKKAAEISGRMVSSYPENWRGYFIHAQRLQSLNCHQDAVRALEQALLRVETVQDETRVRERAVLSLRKLQRWSVAKAQAQKILATDMSAQIVGAIALADVRLDAGDKPSEIEADLAKLPPTTSHPRVFELISECRARRGDREGALTAALDYQQAQPLARACLLVSRRLRSLGRSSAARDELIAGLAKWPTNGELAISLLDALIADREDESLIRHLRLDETFVGNASFVERLGDFYLANRHLDTAHEKWSSAASMGNETAAHKLVSKCLAEDLPDEAQVWLQHTSDSEAKTALSAIINLRKGGSVGPSGTPVCFSTLTRYEIDLARTEFGVYSMPHRRTDLEVLRDGDFGIYAVEGLSHSIRTYTALDIAPNAWFLVLIPHFVTEADMKRQLEFVLKLTRGKIPTNRFVCLANTPNDVDVFRRLGMVHSFLCNQNCWLDYNLFTLLPAIDKQYDLVINTRPEKNLKRPHLAAKVAHLAVIKGINLHPADYFPLESMKPAYINSEGRIGIEDVVRILNKSWCGGIFSAKEGACYSSSEFLLCGLPVVSTKSEGGRDYWYNEDNAIIVEPTEEAVLEAVSKCKKGLLSGQYDPALIRERHITESNRLRKMCAEFMQSILPSRLAGIDMAAQLQTVYRHQFKQARLYIGP